VDLLEERHAVSSRVLLSNLLLQSGHAAAARAELEQGLARARTPQGRAYFARALARFDERTRPAGGPAPIR
jgi:hypothetical protein